MDTKDILKSVERKEDEVVVEEVVETVEQPRPEVKLPSQLTDIIIRHEDEIREVAKEVHEVANFVRGIGKSGIKGAFSSKFFKYVSDKEYVIIGVVIIAICSLFVIPDPTNVLMSIVSGLFGLGTGRAISNSKDDDV